MIPLKLFLQELNNFDSDIKELFQEFLSHENPLLMVAETHWQPNVDIYETPKGIIVKVEIAGVKQKDLDISYYKNELIIKGKRPDYSIPDRIKCKRVEIPYGEFERHLHLDLPEDTEVDEENIKATLKDGMLFVFIPFFKKSVPYKKIEIEGE